MATADQTLRALRSPVRVLIAERRPVIRNGYIMGLAAVEDIVVVGDAADSEGLQAAAHLLRPDVILVGIAVLAPKWSSAAPWKNGGHTAPLVVAMAEVHDAYLAVAAWANAVAYVLEDTRLEEVANILCNAAAGQSGWSSNDRQHALRWQVGVGQPWRSLSGRERDVFRLLVRGMSNVAIADALLLAPKTVEHHVSSILDKLGLASRAMAASWYYDQFPAVWREGERGEPGTNYRLDSVGR